jgi:hypothetical protein
MRVALEKKGGSLKEELRIVSVLLVNRQERSTRVRHVEH